MLGNGQRNAALAVLVLASGAVVASAQAPATGSKAVPASFERFKALAGEWVAAEDGDMSRRATSSPATPSPRPAPRSWRRSSPGSPHEMVTVYHADGPDLVLTHYCMEGNQPRMRAKGAQGSRFDFAYDGGTNIDPKRDRHMHSAIARARRRGRDPQRVDRARRGQARARRRIAPRAQGALTRVPRIP